MNLSERRQRILSVRERIAYHEAGHLAAAHLLNLVCNYATIEPRRPSVAGFVDTDEDFVIGREVDAARQREMARRHILADYAGYAAARIAGSPERWNHGASGDYRRARASAQAYGLNATALRREAQQMIEQHFDLVEIYARALLQNGTLHAEALVALAIQSGVEAIAD